MHYPFMRQITMLEIIPNFNIICYKNNSKYCDAIVKLLEKSLGASSVLVLTEPGIPKINACGFVSR
jgi:hypothetical protein